MCVCVCLRLHLFSPILLRESRVLKMYCRTHFSLSANSILGIRETAVAFWIYQTSHSHKALPLLRPPLNCYGIGSNWGKQNLRVRWCSYLKACCLCWLWKCAPSERRGLQMTNNITFSLQNKNKTRRREEKQTGHLFCRFIMFCRETRKPNHQLTLLKVIIHLYDNIADL